jgi:glycosyltransferase involved in cell wall biosynthesis
MSRRSKAELHITIALPLGIEGHGGINSLISQVSSVICDADHSVRLHMLMTRGRGHIAFSTYWMLRALAIVFYLCVRGQIDVLHINLSKKGSTYRKIVLCAFARMCRVPYVIHLHSGHYREFWQNAGSAMSKLIGRMFSGAGRIIVLGSVWRDLLIEKNPTLSSRVVILHNATHPPRKPWVPSEDGHVRILFLGKLRGQKGVPQLIAALDRLSTLPNWRAILAGDENVAQARNAISVLGLCDRVHIPGYWIEPAGVEDLISNADILVLPSFNEGLPMSVIEGMAAGLAVVTTPVGAVKDIVEHEKTGLLIPPGDVAALASALQRLILDPGLREKLGREAKRFHHANLEISSYARRIQQCAG